VRYLAVGNSYTIMEAYRRHRGFEDLGTGPTTAGEATRRYRAVNENAGQGIRDAQDRLAGRSLECAALLAPVRDAFKEWTGTIEVVIGEGSKNVYSVTIELAGSDMTNRTEIVVDQYNQPVQIEPPEGAQDLPERTQAPNPCS
ncbi:MAG TPA: hypothetical protein VLS25_05125, partial [Dehalococcoidia bacterium]|nr:hypothetical protein [Dehalococcoidia bacterium]